MIHKVAFSNFFSFKERVVIDFVVDGNTPDTDAYHTDVFGTRVSKIMTVVGANASGKTNLLKSVAFLRWFITDSFSTLGPTEPIAHHFSPFIFCADEGTSMFEITFSVGNELYNYELELNPRQVISEKLDIKNLDTKRWSNLFNRKCDPQTRICESNFSKFEVSSDFEKIVRDNSSVISAAKQVNNRRAIAITDYFSNMQSNLSEMGLNEKFTFAEIFSAAEFFVKNPIIKDKAEKILQRFDLGLSKFSINEYKTPDNETIYIPVSHHKIIGTNQEKHLTLTTESGGTQNLFVLLKDVLAALEKGDVVLFDELDNNLHPLMIPEITNLFRSKNTNPNNAQLIFSTHNVQILNELDKQQIVIVEKNEENVSEAWKLSDVEGVRPSDNYHAKYLAGIYGGIPRL